MKKYWDNRNQSDCSYLEELTAELESMKIKNSGITRRRRISLEVEMSV
jgi:hypothetical protein